MKHVAALVSLIGLLAAGASSFADDGPNHRVRNLNFGVSGSNVRDVGVVRPVRVCCVGTLGSLLQQDRSNLRFILSNNHVFARVGRASSGEDIIQQGYNDPAGGCGLAGTGRTVVADYKASPSLTTSNVDAAVAQLRLGEPMHRSGFIEDVGIPSRIIRAPAMGLAVAKSGRTTGFTRGTITMIGADMDVRYNKRCCSDTLPRTSPDACGNVGSFVVKFRNQVLIGPGGFSAGGDSGSLIVTDDSCHQPVALLFARNQSSGITVGNPISEVLPKVADKLRRPLGFVGTNADCTPAAGAAEVIANAPAAATVDAAMVAKSQHEAELWLQPGVIGVAIGAAEDGGPSVEVVVFVDVTTGAAPTFPESIDGFRVRVMFTEPFVAA